MIAIKFFVFCTSFVEITHQIHGLEILSSVEENDMLKTTDVIRNTSKDLFDSLKFSGVKDKPWLEQYAALYNHLVSITKQDYNTLSGITKLAHGGNKKHDNATENLITLINEILDEDPEQKDNDNETMNYIQSFPNKLEDLGNLSEVDDQRVDLELFEQFDRDSNENETQRFHDTTLLGDEEDIEVWSPNTRRVFRGERTKIKYYPFMAGIQIFGAFQCAGSIISHSLIVTASSCVQLAYNNRLFRENPLFLTVHVGSSFYRGGGEVIPVIEVYFYPSYNPKTLRHNICLLRVQRRMKFKGRQLMRIDFDKTASPMPMNIPGVTILGWGAKSNANVLKDPWENILSFAVLDIYPLLECQDVYGKQYVTHQHFCAGFISKGGGACNHDVGGPGLLDNKLVGIISFGSPKCGAPDAPTVFTKVGFYASWIESIMRQPVPMVEIKTTLKYPIINTPLPHEITGRHTFTVVPIVPTTTPKQMIMDEDTGEEGALRIVKDKDLFKEFLKTSYQSKEAKEYEQLLENKSFVKNLLRHITNSKDDRILKNDEKNFGRDKNEHDHKKPTTEKENLVATQSNSPTQLVTAFNYVEDSTEASSTPKRHKITTLSQSSQEMNANEMTAPNSEYDSGFVENSKKTKKPKITVEPVQKRSTLSITTQEMNINKMTEPSSEYDNDFDEHYLKKKLSEMAVIPVREEIKRDKVTDDKKYPSNIEDALTNAVNAKQDTKNYRHKTTTSNLLEKDLQNEILNILENVNIDDILEEVNEKDMKKPKEVENKNLENEMLTLLYLTDDEEKDAPNQLDSLEKTDAHGFGAITNTLSELIGATKNSEEVVDDISSLQKNAFYKLLADAVLDKTQNTSSEI